MLKLTNCAVRRLALSGFALLVWLAAWNSPAAVCRASDCNTNGIQDDQETATGSARDCNTNSIPDECEIAAGSARDCNTNSIPDECEQWRESQKLLPADGGANDVFGFAVAIDASSGLALIGAYKDDDRATDAGAAYVYRFSGGTWQPDSPQPKLTAADSAAADQFGRAVSLSGTTALIGAWHRDDNGTDSGAAYVFVRNPNGDWSQQWKLTAPDGSGSDEFGHVVAISGDTALIGAPRNDDRGSETGSAYFSKRSGGVWSTPVKVLGSDTAAADRFGYAVAIDGDTAVIGALDADDPTLGDGAGAAYVFVRGARDTWTQQAKLTASDGAALDSFGYTLAISGNMVVVTSLFDDDRGTDSGSVFVFVGNGGNWSQQAKLTASDGAPFDYFGNAVSISGDVILSGAYQHDDRGSNSGAAYFFNWNGIAWKQTAKVTSSDAAPDDVFGYAAWISGPYALIGAHWNDDQGDKSGSAYIFRPSGFADCNTNGAWDGCDIRGGTSGDCNSDGVPDECDTTAGTSPDCNTNGIPDTCDIAAGTSGDCNINGVPDQCDIQVGTSRDGDSNGIPDECDRPLVDCNTNSISDEDDIARGTSLDCNTNRVPDECDLAGTGTCASAVGTERVSVGSGGFEGDGISVDPSISWDGCVVAFESYAANLVLQPNDTNDRPDIFAYDRRLGRMEMISVNQQGNAPNHESWAAAISGNGRYVAFTSSASDLVTGDTNGKDDVFVRDREARVTRRVSLRTDGGQGNNHSVKPAISENGCVVAFESTATNLVDGDTNGLADIFAYDCNTRATTLVSVTSSGAQANNRNFTPSVSGDGRFVAFASRATNLAANDDGTGRVDVFVRDRQLGRTELISVNTSGRAGNVDSWGPVISADGRYVAFPSSASDLISGDTNGRDDVFVRDRQPPQRTFRVSVGVNGEQGNDHSQFYERPAISPDGLFVAFESEATNLVPGDTNGEQDIFVRNWLAGTTVRVTVSTAGTQSNRLSSTAGLSTGGRVIAFESDATNLDSSRLDQNLVTDIFVRTQIRAEPSRDCNSNRVPDECDIRSGTSVDCNADGVPDQCDIQSGTSPDGNTNGVPDECDFLTDCNSNSIPDRDDITGATSRDCNSNRIPDECDLRSGTSLDVNANGIPDGCDDCNTNSIPDQQDIAVHTSQDCNTNLTPDECDAQGEVNSYWVGGVGRWSVASKWCPAAVPNNTSDIFNVTIPGASIALVTLDIVAGIQSLDVGSQAILQKSSVGANTLTLLFPGDSIGRNATNCGRIRVLTGAGRPEFLVLQYMNLEQADPTEPDCTNGGELEASGGPNDSTMLLSNCHIHGGRIRTTGTGIVHLQYSTLEDVAVVHTGERRGLVIDGQFDGVGFIQGRVTTEGAEAITVGGDDPQVPSALLPTALSGTALGGSGEVFLRNETTSTIGRLGYDIINESSHTIRGRGRILGSLTNHGTVVANGGTLVVQGGIGGNGHIRIDNATLHVASRGWVYGDDIDVPPGAVRGLVEMDSDSNVSVRRLNLGLTAELTVGAGAVLDVSDFLRNAMTDGIAPHWQWTAGSRLTLSGGRFADDSPHSLEGWATFEAASMDRGPDSGADFLFETIELSGDAHVSLIDCFPNGHAGSPGAVYCQTLNLGTGAVLNLNGLHLYRGGELVQAGASPWGSKVRDEVRMVPGDFDCDLAPDACSQDTLRAFLAVLLGIDTNRYHHAAADYNHDNNVNGADITAFVARCR